MRLANRRISWSSTSASPEAAVAELAPVLYAFKRGRKTVSREPRDPAPSAMTAHDPYNAFCRHTHVELPGARDGPLRGLTFAVKDVFDIAGHRTGNGNPFWLETHAPAERTASAVERLLAAGAHMVGKTYTDEMAYSLNGENVHYGTPTNPRAPGRIPGGSSSGSAVAVAGSLADFALGTDCGGAVRSPASSYCGIFGIRTTHGLPIRLFSCFGCRALRAKKPRVTAPA